MFFSVKYGIKLNGKSYLPCVCYEAGEELEPTIIKLQNEGKAEIYENRVFFRNGKLIESNKVKKSGKKSRK
jgi:hypothetical protein